MHAQRISPVPDRLRAPVREIPVPPTSCLWRQRRLARGWQPVQMVGRMKIIASQDDRPLPDTWLLLKFVYLWENQRVPVSGYLETLLSRVFTMDKAVTR